MAKMRFEADGEGNPSKIGLGMYSKEEEYVPFNQSCDCSGQVKYTRLSFIHVFETVQLKLPQVELNAKDIYYVH